MDWDFENAVWNAKEFGGKREVKGKEFLDRARSLGEGRAYLVTGLSIAFKLPNGFPKVYGTDLETAVKYLNVAQCNGYASQAREYLAKIEKESEDCGKIKKLVQR